MPASPTSPLAAAVVEVLVSSPGFSDAEHVEFADDNAARTFTREVMRFAASGVHGRCRGKATPPAESERKE